LCLELLKVLQCLAGGAAGTFHAPLKLGEGFAAVGGGLAEGVLGVGAVIFLVVVGPDLGFGGAVSACCAATPAVNEMPITSHFNIQPPDGFTCASNALVTIRPPRFTCTKIR